MRPVGIGLPGPQHNVQPPARPVERSGVVATTPGPVLVQPQDDASWADWQSGRDSVLRDGAEHPALNRYREIAQGDLRQQLQAMLGVDLYV